MGDAAALDEAAAYAALESLRWPDGLPTCPHCGERNATFIRPSNGVSRRTRTGSLSERRVWRCRTCREQFSVLTDTFLHGTKAPVAAWVIALGADSACLSVRALARRCGVNPSTAQRMRLRLVARTDARGL